MPGKSKKGGGLKSSPTYKKSPLYNYRSPRDYKVFNMGNRASAPFKMKSPLEKLKLTPAQQARYDRRMARQERRAQFRSNMSQSNFSKTKAPAWTFPSSSDLI